jgi:hypothetical protein
LKHPAIVDSENGLDAADGIDAGDRLDGDVVERLAAWCHGWWLMIRAGGAGLHFAVRLAENVAPGYVRRVSPRPRKPGKPDGAPSNLSFQAEAGLIRDLTAEAEACAPELGFRPSRTQLVKALLKEGIEARRERRKAQGTPE